MKKPIHPLWGIVEIAAVGGIYFYVVWIWGLQMAESSGLIVASWIIFSFIGIYLLWISPVLLHRDKPETRGWILMGREGRRPGSLKNAWPFYAALTLVGVVLLLVYAVVINGGMPPQINEKSMALKFLVYLGWAFVQGVFFYNFILVRLRGVVRFITRQSNTLLHCGVVVVLSAALFTLFHVPNIPLMMFAFPAGIVWSWMFYQRPNIMLMVLSHAVLGTTLHQVVQLHTRIGPFYANPDANMLGHIIPGLSRIIGYVL